MSTYDEANEIEFFNDCIDNLAKELFHDDNDFSLSYFERPNDRVIRKSAWVASILASSHDEKHRRKALAFAILAYARHRGDEEKEELYEQYLYIILSRIGDLPAIGSFVDEEVREEYDQELLTAFDSVLSHELDTYRERYRFGDEYYLSEFQNDVYQALDEGNDVAISGPTSSGKSFVLQQFIERRVEDEDCFEVIYVVPTRALISEVSTKLKDRHEEIIVKTSANFTEEDEDVFLVVTPERCLKLLRDEMREHINPDLIFFDEFQKIEEGERGIVFENVVESLHEMWPDAQISVAGPYLDDPRDKLENITGRGAVEVKTFFTPILQLKIFITFESQNRGERKLKITIMSPSDEEKEFQIDEPRGLTFSQFNTNKGEFLRMALDEFGKEDQNLVYASRKDYAERWAKTIADGKDRRALSEDAEALRKFLARSIHENYTLIHCLERGVAFHHRMVPKIARTKIEEIYRDENDFDTIVSTPTLLEGVNLPAENIFIHDPSKGPEELTDFDFKNLIGRVGRLNQKLYGSVYCLQTEEDEWSEEKLSDTENKEIEPATEKAINSDIDELKEVVGKENIYEEDEAHLRYTGILLRNKHLRDEKELSEYLNKKDVQEDDAAVIKSTLARRLDQIEIPEGILRRNPTIDPVQQDKLYRAVKENPANWMIAEHRSGYDYDAFMEVTRNLNEIFLFSNDAERGYRPSETEIEQHDIEHVVVPANQWLNGYTLRQMIEARQTHDRIDDNDVNDSIRSVLQIVNDDIRFVLVKYYRILTDILEETETTDSEWMLTFDQMLEMGSLDFNELDLMSMGVDRSVVIDLDIPSQIDDVVEYLEENRWEYPKFYIDHLEEQDVL